MKTMKWMTGVLLTGMFFLISCDALLSKGDVTIGVIIPQEGSSLQEYGYQITSGIQLAMEDLKAAGKLTKNYTLEIRNENMDDVENVKQTFQELVDLGVVAVIGPASSASILEMVNLANDTKTVLVSPAASSPDINPGDVNSNDYIFRNQPSDTLEAQTIVNHMFNRFRMQKLLVVRSKNTYAEGISYEVLRFGRQNRNQIPGEVIKFEPDPEKVDYVAVVDRIVEHLPQAVFMGGYSAETVPLIKEIRAREELKDTFLFTSSSLLVEDAINALGAEVLEGLMFTSYPWNPAEGAPHVQSFAKRFEEQYHAKPNIYAANGYDSMIAVTNAVEVAQHWLHGAVRDEMNKIEFDLEATQGLGAPILRDTNFNKRGDVTRIPVLYRIVGGVPTTMTSEDIDAIRDFILTQI